MTRILGVLGSVLLLAICTAAAVWYLAFGVGRRLPGELAVPGMSGGARVEWLDGRDAVVHLSSADDAQRSLGAVHALGRPWTLLLLRQAALGRLSEWYGQATAGLDRHVRLVGLPREAAAAWEALATDERVPLADYAAGINAALLTERVRLAAPLAALSVEPDRWQPWHALAVERLVDWLATPPPEDSLARSGAVLRLLQDRDRLASFLALSGLDHAATWTTGDHPDGLFVRYVYGSAADPPITAVRLDGPGGSSDAITWVGIPTPLAIRDAGGARASIPGGRLRVTRGPAAGTATWETFTVRGTGTEVVARHASGPWWSVGSSSDSLLVRWDEEAPRPDSAPAVSNGSPAGRAASRSSGLLGVAVLELGREPALPGASALVRGREPTSVGAEPVRSGRVTLLSFAPEASELAISVGASAGAASALFADPGSAWAAALLPAFVDAIVRDSTAAPPDSDAVAFLRNWNGVFEGSSIGATLFDPLSRPGDRRADRLAAAVDSLLRIHGPDRRTWRWERDSTSWLRWPGGPGLDLDPLPGRYGPVAYPRRGHPTAPEWGSSPSWVRHPAPGAWEGFLPTESRTPVVFRRPAVPYDRFLGRITASPEQRDFHLLRFDSPSSPVTVIEPPR